MRACLLWLSLAACVPLAGDELDDSDVGETDEGVVDTGDDVFPGVAPDHPCLALRGERAWPAADVWSCVAGFGDGERAGYDAGAAACAGGGTYLDTEAGAEIESPYGAGRAAGYKLGFAQGWSATGC
jgi:hypothetical protein